MNKILVTGADGLVGSRFIELFPEKEKLLTPSLTEFDLLRPESIIKYIRENVPSAVVHFAAFTDVGAAEKERNDTKGLCWQINVDGLQTLLSALPEKTYFIHISTDYVFPGNKEFPGPYSEDQSAIDDAEKLTWYGYTKAEGERLVKASKVSSSIVRINNPVRSSGGPKLDFLRKPLALFDEGKLYPLFYDQNITITYIDEASQLINTLISKKLEGTFHASSVDSTTPYEVISYMLKKTLGKIDIKKMSLKSFVKKGNDKRRYPQYSGLHVKLTQNKTGIYFSSTLEIVDKLIMQGLSTP